MEAQRQGSAVKGGKKGGRAGSEKTTRVGSPPVTECLAPDPFDQEDVSFVSSIEISILFGALHPFKEETIPCTVL